MNLSQLLLTITLTFSLFMTGCGVSMTAISQVSSTETRTLDRAVSARYFGMHSSQPAKGAWPSVAFGTLRLWDSNVTWLQIEPARGRWDFTGLDPMISLAAQQNVEVIMPLGLTPHWAASRPSEPCPYGGEGGCSSEPVLIQDWTDYVDAVVTRYKGRIAYYEIWNEINLSEFWTGTPQMMLQMQQVAYAEIKRIDPAAQVVSPSMVGTDVSYMQTMLGLGMANYADVIGYHFYVGTPELLPSLVSAVSNLLNSKGIHKPLWNTESGWLPPEDFDDDQAAAFVVRTLLIGQSEGLGRFLWYQWDNRLHVALFMVEADGVTATPAAHAYAQLQIWLVGSQLGTCAADRSNLWSCAVNFADGSQGEVMWYPGGSHAMTKTLAFTPKTTVDMYGNISAWPKGGQAITNSPILLRN